MHTKEQLRDLRDLLILERNSPTFNDGYFRDYWQTKSFIYEALCDSTEPHEVKGSMLTYCAMSKNLPCVPPDTDYKLAYDLIFGDISVAPLHINDALEPIAKWRLKQSE